MIFLEIQQFLKIQNFFTSWVCKWRSRKRGFRGTNMKLTHLSYKLWFERRTTKCFREASERKVEGRGVEKRWTGALYWAGPRVILGHRCGPSGSTAYKSSRAATLPGCGLAGRAGPGQGSGPRRRGRQAASARERGRLGHIYSPVKILWF